MSDFAISLKGVSKHYPIWHSSGLRFIGALATGAANFFPALSGLAGRFERRFAQKFVALEGLDLHLSKGEAVAIIGRNGAGKSTLLQLVSGIVPPTSGTVACRGRVAALLELGSGFNPDFTGRENVVLNASIHGLNHDQISQRISLIEAFAEIGEFFDRPVKTYSSGMVMRLAFAVIVHIDADVLIVDEALAVGDALFVQKCMKWIREFRVRGTLLFVAHNMSDVVALCDRALWLRDGKMVEQGPAKLVAENYLAWLNIKADRTADIDAARRARRHETPNAAERATLTHDMRREWLNRSPHRNDIEVFAFNPDSAGYGVGKARITKVEVLDASTEAPLAWIVGGEDIVIRITVLAEASLDHVILGFYLKDRLGQNILGDNTFLATVDSPVSLSKSQGMEASFHISLPLLPVGRYVIVPAVASGTQECHVQQHWIHEAVVLESRRSSVIHGIVGISAKRIDIQVNQGQ
ncbi:ABC transporter ATP-binding protein [Nibricoccus sp. IMCC34717]|uniref:ABC transporter ATP-binding protein n=1 Tax=Nibricoccus sp. IMCC34717 TaxID=3034021 RepID=UPI00384D1DA5